ncbi:helix-turn-helix domain-containing protein [Salipiger thiooxidans]|uniref:helix-turn-helix domain-containing protein n=1 Tax=Salipiger thiooxidans TaxID=282683 RepID=UPI001CD53955|nr:LysR family transcriptional regulator [Salipiger thiooxidans]MCA0849373.1 LysR family transcriptional regulator [Salipiger thiooxidans]
MGLANLSAFVHAVRPGSLADASRHLDPEPMATWRRRAALEDELGARLLHRTTRAVPLAVICRKICTRHCRTGAIRGTCALREPALSRREWRRGDPREEERGRR